MESIANPSELSRLRKALLEYCKQDNLGPRPSAGEDESNGCGGCQRVGYCSWSRRYGPCRIDRIRPDTGRCAGRCVDGVRFRCGRIPLPVRDGDIGGGEFRISRAFVNADVPGTTGSPTLLGLGLTYDREEYTFSVPSGLAAPAPGVQFTGCGFSPSIMHSISPTGGFCSPLPSAMPGRRVRNRATRWSTARSSRLRRPSGRICPSALGRGVSTDRPVAPLPVPFRPVADQRPVELSNPLRVGPLDPRGWNWRTSIDGNWEAAAGGAYRSYRFPAGRGRHRPRRYRRDRGNPLFAALSADVAARVGGGLVRGGRPGGKARPRKRTGDRIASTSFDPAHLAGLFVTRKF